MAIDNLDRVDDEVEILDSYGDESKMDVVTQEKECVDCGSPFTLVQGEINYFIQHALIVPKRCKPCRATRKTSPITRLSETLPAERVGITCDHCGRYAEVPFKPFVDAPVYCRVCWVGIKNIGAPSNNSQSKPKYNP